MKTFNVVVKKAFRDRYSGIKHKVGDKLTITEDRFREIQRSGDYVAKEATTNVASKPEKATNEIKK